jgi:hypothetical protein
MEKCLPVGDIKRRYIIETTAKDEFAVSDE